MGYRVRDVKRLLPILVAAVMLVLAGCRDEDTPRIAFTNDEG
jgi:hypothetical protein